MENKNNADELITVVENVEETTKATAEPNAAVTEALKKEIDQLAVEIKEENKELKAREKNLASKKDRFKEIAKTLGIDYYENDLAKISLTTVDKSYLRVDDTIEYLRNKGFNKYIHTKEYFLDEEIYMAISRNEIKSEDMAQFMETKTETRMNIR